MSAFISRGFSGHRRVRRTWPRDSRPGQYIESGYPVLTAGPTPRIETGDWSCAWTAWSAIRANGPGRSSPSSRSKRSPATSTA